MSASKLAANVRSWRSADLGVVVGRNVGSRCRITAASHLTNRPEGPAGRLAFHMKKAGATP